MSYPSVTIVRYGGSATITMLVTSVTIVNRWAPEPTPPGDAGQWLFDDANNSDQAMLIW